MGSYHKLLMMGPGYVSLLGLIISLSCFGYLKIQIDYTIGKWANEIED